MTREIRRIRARVIRGEAFETIFTSESAASSDDPLPGQTRCSGEAPDAGPRTP